MTAEGVLEVLNQDLDVALSYYDEENFDSLNIIGNRVATNLAIGGKKELIMAGFIIKDLAGQLSRIEEIGELKESKPVGRRFLSKLKESFEDPPVEGEEIWNLYTGYGRSIRKFLLPESERTAYSDAPDYANRCRKFLIEYLFKKKHILVKEEANIVNGIASELGRVINTYGFHPGDLAFYLTLRALSRCYPYFKQDYLVAENDKEKEEKRKEITSKVDKIYELNDAELELSSLRKQLSRIIGDIGARWRMLYMEYGEISPRREMGRRIKLPEETREKISDVLVEGLRRELE